MKTTTISKNYQVLINNEDIWLRRNYPGSKPMKIGKFIGASNCCLISNDEKYVMIGGYGLMMIDIDNFMNGFEGNPERSIMIYFRDKEVKFWINKIWQDNSLDKSSFCFISNLKQYCFKIENGYIKEIGKFSNQPMKNVV